jgi:mono/diheme cytochrome c family protein
MRRGNTVQVARSVCVALALFLCCESIVARAADGSAKIFFSTHCVACHGEGDPQGGLDLTSVPRLLAESNDEVSPETRALWVRIHDRIAAGEMPPKSKPRPSADELRTATEWLSGTIIAAEKQAAPAERTRIRRLTRVEYEQTLRDLFELPHLNLRELLPGDGSAHGFDNNADALDISHVNMARYLDAADAALDLAIATRPTAPKVQKQRVSLCCRGGATSHVLLYGDAVFLKNKQPDPEFPPATEHHHIDQGAHERLDFYNRDASVGVFRPEDDAFYPYFLEFSAIYPGQYRVKASFWSFTWDQGKVLPARWTETARLSIVHLQADGRHGGHPNEVLGYYDAPSLKEQVHTIDVWLNRKDTLGFNAASLAPNRVSERKGRLAKFVGPGVACDGIEVEGPFYASWPPSSHNTLFGELPLVEFRAGEPANVRYPKRVGTRQEIGAASNRPDDEPGTYTVRSDNPLADADRLLAAFLPRAFRRPVSDDVRRGYVEIVDRRLAAGDCFELALRAAYRTALCSPDFLYHVEPAGPLDHAARANRLAYFFWNAAPDQKLAEFAASDRAGDEAAWRAEAERLLADPKSSRFVESFTGQWLKLRNIASTNPDNKLYPEHGLFLQDAMVTETRAYFRELLDSNLTADHLLASDFAMLNGRLARHYGIGGVDGTGFRKVPLPADSVRGGFLTQASLLKITANGTTTSPVPRGAFVLDRLLGRPPQPPPPNIPAVEPDVRGAVTIREQLAKHRDHVACAACHARMDPPGFALEAFDVIGGYRTRYRSLGAGDAPDVSRLDPFTHAYFRDGPPVDATGTLPDGRTFADVRELRRLLLEDRAGLVDNLARQLLVYGTGRPVSFGDRAELRRIVDTTLSQGGGVRTLLLTVLGSPLFTTR